MLVSSSIIVLICDALLWMSSSSSSSILLLSVQVWGFGFVMFFVIGVVGMASSPAIVAVGAVAS
eukprot:3315983-Karenia_brevis.AAC.1